MIRMIIADDEKHARERLVELLSEYGFFDLIGEAKNGNEALEMIVSRKPDVAFLDIHMPGVSVFDSISSLNDPPLIVFQTAYSEYATKAFNVEAVDYLLKPVSRQRLTQTVEKIKRQIELKPLQQSDGTEKQPDKKAVEHLAVKVRGSIKLIPVKTISKICFEEGFSYIYADKERYISDKYLNYYERKLHSEGFFRTSRTALVNLQHISAIHAMFHGTYLVELKDKSTVELSRRRASELKKTIDF